MLAEFKRIMGEVVSSSNDKWQNYYSKIITQAKLERGGRVTKCRAELMEDENGEYR